jgi:hypothetical protein
MGLLTYRKVRVQQVINMDGQDGGGMWIFEMWGSFVSHMDKGLVPGGTKCMGPLMSPLTTYTTQPEVSVT